jgi:ribonuclease J
LTVDKKNGNLLTSPDIISRGFIYMRDSEELMTGLRFELKRAVQQRFKRVELDRFKTELKDHLTHYLFEHTQRSPIIIPVVNVISGGGANGKTEVKTSSGPQRTETSEDIAAQQQKRFEEMRARLLTQDSRVD